MQLAANSQCSAFVGFPRTPKKSESASICKTCVNALLVSAVEATQHSRKEYVSNATRSQLSMLCFCYQWKQRNTPEKNMSPIQLAAKCQCSAFVTSGSNATLHKRICLQCNWQPTESVDLQSLPQCSAYVGFPRAPRKSESASICSTKEYVSNATGSQQTLSICSPCLNALLMLGFREPRESLRARRSAILVSMLCLCQ